MTGWEHRWSKKKLEQEMSGSILNIISQAKKCSGKEYKKRKKNLAVVIKDLVNHPNCRDLLQRGLCRFLITDEPTKR